MFNSKITPKLKSMYCNKVIWYCIVISHWKLLHSNILMLRFAKRYRILSSISKISLCFQAWLYALKLLLFFKSSRSLLFFHYRRITFSRLDLTMIYKSQNNRFLKSVMFSLNEHVAPNYCYFWKKELTCSHLLILYYRPMLKYSW